MNENEKRSSAVAGSLANSKEEYLIQAFRKYTAIAQVLATDNSSPNPTSFVLDKLEQITTRKGLGIFSVPFIFLEGSSGVGKTQMAFTLLEQLKDTNQAYYFLFSTPGEQSQDIYRYYENISKVFYQCRTQDEVSFSNGESVSCDEVYEKELYVYGFIYTVLKKGLIDKVDISPKTGKAVWELIVKKGLDKNRPVFIIDECVQINDETDHIIKFVVNCFRSLGLGLVILGTNSRVAQITTTKKFTESREGKGHDWCHVNAEYPLFKSNDNETPDWLNKVLSNSRPYFAQTVIDELNKFEDRKNLKFSDFDTVLAKAFRRIIQHKKIFENEDGRLGQIRLFQNAHYGLEDYSDKVTALIHCHFAELNEKLEKKQFTVKSNGFVGYMKWKPSSRFPKVEVDLLLYMILMGGKDHGAFYLEKDVEVPYATFLMQYTDSNANRRQI